MSLPVPCTGRAAALLQGVAQVTHQLLIDNDFATAIPPALAILGELTGVDRVYLFTVHSQQQELALKLEFEWFRQPEMALRPQASHPPLTLTQMGLGCWHHCLAQGSSITALTRNLPRDQQDLLTAQGVKSVLIMPILLPAQGDPGGDRKLWGLIGFDDCHQDRHWSRDEEAVMSTLAANIGGLVARQQTEKSLREAAEREQLLTQTSLRIRQSLDLEEILATTVQEVRQLLGCDRVLVGDMQGPVQGKIIAESLAPNISSMRDILIDEAALEEIRGKFAQGAVSAYADTAQAPPGFLNKRNYLDRYQIRASVAVPIPLGSAFYGVLVAHQCSTTRQWQPLEIDLLQKLSTQVAIALQQAQLYQQVQNLNTNLDSQVEERTRELHQRMAELQNLHQVREVFLQAVTHDLRTPLMGTILVLRTWLQTPGDPLSIPRGLLERMVDSINRQLVLINSLLEVHSQESRSITLTPQALSIQDLIQEVTGDLEPLLHKNQATLAWALPNQAPPVMADAQQIRRVLENLLTNALKHNPPGLNIQLRLEKEATGLKVSVQDDGVGMNPEDQAGLFERCVLRGKGRYSPGIGLGLYLCSQIITAHGGIIGVDSTPGQGSTFWFTLPWAESLRPSGA